jgi:ankyrin repeat protein
MAALREDFLRAATWHGSLDEAEAILRTHPELATLDIHTAAVLGDDVAVRQFIDQDRTNVTAKSGPYGGDALNYLCLSRYLRLDPSRSAAFLRTATALLDAGADPNTGFWTTGQHPEFETALYGAAGVAHHEALTRLLIERGADPNDVEAVYHSPEGEDSGAMKVLVETGRVTPEHLALMLVRKHDWHDYDGVKYLLERGADPDYQRDKAWIPVHHAVSRDNSLEILELLLDHGADFSVRKNGRSAIELAAERGRGDLLELLESRNIVLDLHGVHRLLAACARDDGLTVHQIVRQDPAALDALLVDGGARLAEFAGTWNTEGVEHLLDLGVPVDARYEGDGYFDIAKDSTALHVAAWKLHLPTVTLLIGRGAEVNLEDAKGRTPLALAVKACVDSYWTERRSPKPARALLEAGATLHGVRYPSGYAEVDTLLEEYQRKVPGLTS